MRKTERKKLLDQVKQEILGLTHSPLYSFRVENHYQPVIGAGNIYAKIMFIGEAPGKNEALTARPFCGRAGKILDELLSSIELKREDIYITNIVNDRPPGNRDPKPSEIALYAPFLKRQIEIIQPRVIVTLGRFSMAYIMEQYGLEAKIKPISQMHGLQFKIEMSYGQIILMPFLHPAVAIYRPMQKDLLLDTFQDLKALL